MEKEADVLIELMDLMYIQKAILFGHSDGGTIALIAAAKFPDRISAVISEAAHVFVEDITIKGIKKSVNAFQKEGLRERLYKYHGDKTDLVFSLWANTWLSESFRDMNTENLLPQIICPVFVIQGDKDEFGTMKQVLSILNNVSGKAEKYIVHNVGHSPHKEVPNLILQKTAEFIQTYISK